MHGRDRTTTIARHFRTRSRVVAIAVLLAAAPDAHGQTVLDQLWVTNGEVRAIASTGSTVFFGGSFDRVGPWLGGAATLDRGPSATPTKPYTRVVGTVYASVPDGSGGWLIGGSFTSVQGQPRSNLARLQADGTVAPWNPGANGTVRAIASEGGVVYVGGEFTIVRDIPRSRLAAIGLASGELEAWDPGANGSVFELVVSGGKLYAGGAFRIVAGQVAPAVAAFDLPGGALSTVQPAGPDRNGSVQALHASGDKLYLGGSMSYAGPPTGSAALLDPVSGVAQTPFFDVVGTVRAIAEDGAGGWYIGGRFTSVRGQARQNLAHVLADGTVADLNPAPDDTVRAIVVTQDTVIVGGNFFQCGGITRSRLAALNGTTGELLGWNAQILGLAVHALALESGRLYVGGDFTLVGGAARRHLVVLDVSTGVQASGQPLSPSAPVRAIALGSGFYFAGGDFVLVARASPGLVQLDAVSGAALPTQWPVDGSVYAIEPDGAGGWLIGGSFTAVLGQPRVNLAHVLADGSLDPWTPSTNGLVRALVRAGNTLFVGGHFGTAGGQPRTGIASFDLTSGNLNAWAPQLTSSHSVYVRAMLMLADTLVFGGHFENVNGQPRSCLARVHGGDGGLSSWDPDLRFVQAGGGAWPHVGAMTVAFDALYVQGFFNRAKTLVRGNLAAIDLPSGYPTSFAPISNALNSAAIAVCGDTVFFGGDLTTVNSETRNGLAAVHAGTGTLLPWNPNLNGQVIGMEVVGGTLHVCGQFDTAGGQERKKLVAYERGTGLQLPWAPGADADVFTLSATGSTIAAGGAFAIAGGHTRNRAAGFVSGSGAVLFSHPNLNGPVHAIAISGTTVYLGGSFTTMGNSGRNRLGAQDLDLGLRPWNPNADNIVRSLAVSGGIVYAGGEFTKVTNITRSRLAAMDAGTGALQPWDPEAGGSVGLVRAMGSSIAVGGSFIGVGGRARSNLAQLDLATGRPTAFKIANQFGSVRAVLTRGNAVYAGGNFNVPRNNAAAFDHVTGATLAWNPNAGTLSNAVEALATSGDTIYLGGSFLTAGGQTRRRVAAVDAVSGTANGWIADADGNVLTLGLSGGRLFIGGGFGSVGQAVRANIAALDAITGEPRAWAPVLNAAVNALALDGDRLFVGGNFSFVDAALQQRLAVLDTTTGQPLTPDLEFDGSPNTIAIEGGKIYLGGTFFAVGAVQRYRLAALDRSSLALTSWNPHAGNSVQALAVADGNVYAGGLFTLMGGITRRYLAALDTTNGGVAAWNPDLDNDVQSLAIAGSHVFAGGNFTTIGGAGRARLAAIDRATGAATGWNPSPNGSVHALKVANGAVLAGGAFTTIGGAGRARLATIDAASGAALPWAPSANNTVRALLRDQGTLYVGGSFSMIAGAARTGFAGLADPLDPGNVGVPGPPPLVSGFQLAPVSPNPFRGSGLATFSLPRAGSVKLRLFDTSGRVMQTVLEGDWLEAGPHQVPITVRGMVPGLYWWRLEWEGHSLVQRMVALP